MFGQLGDRQLEIRGEGRMREVNQDSASEGNRYEDDENAICRRQHYRPCIVGLVSGTQDKLVEIQTRNARWSLVAALLTALTAVAGAVSLYLSTSATSAEPTRSEAKTGGEADLDPTPVLDAEVDRAIPAHDPFGTADGWANLRKEGDPWALSVGATLANMKIPAWATKLPTDRPLEFRLEVCKNGTVSRVYVVHSSGDSDFDSSVKGELDRLKLSRLPAHITNQMSSSCAVLEHTFTWGTGR